MENTVFNEGSIICSWGTIISKLRFADNTAIISKTQEELLDMVNRLIHTERSMALKSTSTNYKYSIPFKAGNRELKEVYFKYFGSVLTRGGCCKK